MAAAENLMTGNPDMTAIYATGEPALLGAVAAVESQGKQDQVKIVGWDLTAQAIKGIDKGYVVGVVQQDPAGMGAAAVDALLTPIKGGRRRRARSRGADHHRHQGERRALPRRLQMTLGTEGGGAPDRAASARVRARHQQALRLDRGAAWGRPRVWPGEVLGLVGDNAAGKSTLTKIIAGAYVPDAGASWVDGQPVRLHDARGGQGASDRDGLSGPVLVRHGRCRRQPVPRPRTGQAHLRAAAARPGADAAAGTAHLGPSTSTSPTGRTRRAALRRAAADRSRSPAPPPSRPRS